MVSANKYCPQPSNYITWEVHIVEIAQGKAMDDEVWITSDGRAYLCGLHGNSARTSTAGKQLGIENDLVRDLVFSHPLLWC